MPTARDTDFSDFSLRETIRFYEKLRRLVYEDASTKWPILQIGSITLHKAQEADAWVTYGPAERAAWSWVDAFHIYNRKSSFKRFDICINRGGNLVGLSYGIPTAHKTKLKVDIVEATPLDVHKGDTKVFEVISECAQIYAVLLGADEVRIMNPLNKALTDYYCSYGFEYVEPAKKSLGVYCSLKVEV